MSEPDTDSHEEEEELQLSPAPGWLPPFHFRARAEIFSHVGDSLFQSSCVLLHIKIPGGHANEVNNTFMIKVQFSLESDPDRFKETVHSFVCPSACH